MSSTVIQVENVSKYYRLGLVGTGSLSHDLNRAWAKLRGKPDPTLRIGQKENSTGDDYIWALREISFEVKQGEVLGIIGRNGAGKSTLLKILSRVTAPTSGECRVKGRIASLLEVGTGFHPELTGRENIFLNGTILGMSRAEVQGKFKSIATFAEVEKHIDTPIKRYSSGMFVRLAFAVAAHLEPEILVVDEVLAVGDVEFQAKCLGKMQDISEHGRTVLFVSHNMAAIKKLCSRTILLDRGRIEVDGDTEDVVDVYLHKGRAEDFGRRTKQQHEFNLSIEKVTLHEESGESKEIFRTDEKLIVRCHINNENEQRKIGLFLSVEDLAMNRLFASYSIEEGYVFNAPRGKSCFDFIIPGIPLNNGQYSISATLHNAKPDVHVDGIYQACYFEIRNPLEHNRQMYFNTNIGIMKVSHLWSLPKNIMPR